MQTVENTTYTFKDFIQDHPELKLTGNDRRPLLTTDDLLKIMKSKAEPFKYRLTLTNAGKSVSFDYSMGVGLLEATDMRKVISRFPSGKPDKYGTKSVQLPFKPFTYRYDAEKWLKKYKPRPAQPDLETVLYSLASDSQALPNYECFEDWASEYGYDEDSREAERTYNLCIKQARELRDVLGREAFDQLLTCEEE